MPVLQGPEFYISKRIGRAMIDYAMLCEGDRIAIALSGGVDSLTLLQVMLDRQSFVPVKYDIVAIHIDTGISKKSLTQLDRFCTKLKVPFHSFKLPSIRVKRCVEFSWFTGNRREELLRQVHHLKCNKVALGQHREDIVETILLKMFFAGEVSILPAHEKISPKVSIIRPMVYVEEKLIQSFVKIAQFPKIAVIDPSVDSAKRSHVATMIRAIERNCPEVKTNMFRSLTRVKIDYLL